MMWGLLWIIGCYGMAAAILHALHAAHIRRSGKQQAVTTFALITHNNEAQIEWYLRSLLFVSRLRGRKIAILIFDEQSTDDTVAIASRIGRENGHGGVTVMNQELDSYLMAHPEDAIILHRILNRGNGERLTVLQG